MIVLMEKMKRTTNSWKIIDKQIEIGEIIENGKHTHFQLPPTKNFLPIFPRISGSSEHEDDKVKNPEVDDNNFKMWEPKTKKSYIHTHLLSPAR